MSGAKKHKNVILMSIEYAQITITGTKRRVSFVLSGEVASG
jgi:hypothetical protein